jgi:hypothetical protein
MDGVDGAQKILQGLFCIFLFRVFCVIVPGDVSLWYLPERDRVCCNVLLFT